MENHLQQYWRLMATAPQEQKSGVGWRRVEGHTQDCQSEDEGLSPMTERKDEDLLPNQEVY